MDAEQYFPGVFGDHVRLVSKFQSGGAPVADAMNELVIFNQELSRLVNEVTRLATSYWETLEDRQSYPSTSGKQTTELFTRTWPEEGRGREVLQDFMLIAEHSRPSTGRFFGYVFGSGEPVGTLAAAFRSGLDSRDQADEYRTLIVIDGGQVRVFTRNGNDWTRGPISGLSMAAAPGWPAKRP